MPTFKTLQNSDNIRELIKSTFDADLDISGGWGYTQKDATVIASLPQGMPLKQLEHMLSTIRAHLEMNITQTEENRYGGINANETARVAEQIQKSHYDEVTYEVTGIKEALNTEIIKEYKAGYGKEDFDMNAHFQKRKDATLVREVTHYFEVSAVQ